MVLAIGVMVSGKKLFPSPFFFCWLRFHLLSDNLFLFPILFLKPEGRLNHRLRASSTGGSKAYEKTLQQKPPRKCLLIIRIGILT
jgi:hypothetical protein